MPVGSLETVLHALRLSAAAVYCFILPGYASFVLLYPTRRPSWLAQLAIASGLSVVIYPLLFLWAYTLRLSVWPLLVWAPGAVGALSLAWLYRPTARQDFARQFQAHGSAANIALLAVVGGIVATRFLPVGDMIAPAWGDSVHHTMIVELIRENGGLFQSWAPYAPIESFSYHFGFHVNMAVWAVVSGQNSVQAVISGGQLFNILAVLALYPVAVRLGGNRMAGLVAVMAAGFLTQQPAMYVNWGRYTQLAAQIILPVWLWALDVWWTETKRPRLSVLAILALLASGLALTHYRVTVVGVCAAIAWGIWSLWLMRSNWREWLARAAWILGAGVVALLFVLPWMLTVRAGRLSQIAGSIAQRSTDLPAVRGELSLWSDLAAYYEPYLVIVALAAVVLALWSRRQLAVPVLGWVALTFVAANPFLVGLAGTGIVTNFLVALGLYIPLALMLGWLFAQMWTWLGKTKFSGVPVGQFILAAILILLTAMGFRRQIGIVDPFYQMVTADDVAAFNWIDQNTDRSGRFLVNAFPAYEESLVVGSDAGWWLPYYTLRASTLPPILYSVESLSPDTDRESFRQIVFELKASRGDAHELRRLLCHYGISHVYLGDRQGMVGFGDTQLIPPEWLHGNGDFHLLFGSGNAQVWSFDIGACTTSQ